MALPFGPTLELELANAFTGLVGGTVGTTATIIRFFQRRGLAVSVAVTSGVLVSLAGMIAQAGLFVVAFAPVPRRLLLGSTTLRLVGRRPRRYGGCCG